jgi:hypothetical protein
MCKYFVISLWICGWEKTCSISSGSGSPSIVILDGMWCSPVEFQSKGLLAATFLLAVFLVYFSALMIGTVCFFKMSVNFYRTTRRHNPEDGTFHSRFRISDQYPHSFLLRMNTKCCLPVKTVSMLENVKLILNITFQLVIKWQCHCYVASMIGWLRNVEYVVEWKLADPVPHCLP